jgi:DNA-binding transcriptional MerR regulator
LSNIKGTEIYLLESECRNENSYNEYKTESEQKAFLEKYKKTENIPIEKCAYYIDLENCKTQSEPFLNENDIEKFDWNSSKIYLSQSGIKKLKNQEIPLRGLAFIIKIKGNNIYGGWFWNMFSSFGCDRVFSYPDKNAKENELDLEFGLGGFKCGKDPRTDEKLVRNAINN